jgi:hypothetical protein
MTRRETIMRWALEILGHASREDVEAALEDMEQGAKKRPPPRLRRKLAAFEKTLRKVRTQLRLLPEPLRSVVGEHRLDEERCQVWLRISEEYPRPGDDPTTAWRHRLEAALARRLLVRQNKRAGTGEISKLAAIFSGNRSADLRRYARELRGQLESPSYDDVDVFFSPTVSAISALEPSRHDDSDTIFPPAVTVTKPNQK